PTETFQDRRNYVEFRKKMLKGGFQMFQFSVYWRYCFSREELNVHAARVRSYLPPKGKVCMLPITDKQFGMMEVYHGRSEAELPKQTGQLSLF
ncbi:MAG: CRISPR-associated endonuclease Cas2, partial [Bacteroidia bacterium]|nr:CRISPR-associated endonuclease Cas2 [Bacteroidia bacterium]